MSPPTGFIRWRRVHRLASWIVLLLGMAHCGIALMSIRGWGPDDVWFLGAGLGVLLVGALNLAHIGVEPCRMPTARFVRWASVIYTVFGVAALVAVPEAHVVLLVTALVVQAAAGPVTLPGH